MEEVEETVEESHSFVGSDFFSSNDGFDYNVFWRNPYEGLFTATKAATSHGVCFSQLEACDDVSVSTELLRKLGIEDKVFHSFNSTYVTLNPDFDYLEGATHHIGIYPDEKLEAAFKKGMEVANNPATLTSFEKGDPIYFTPGLFSNTEIRSLAMEYEIKNKKIYDGTKYFVMRDYSKVKPLTLSGQSAGSSDPETAYLVRKGNESLPDLMRSIKAQILDQLDWYRPDLLNWFTSAPNELMSFSSSFSGRFIVRYFLVDTNWPIVKELLADLMFHHIFGFSNTNSSEDSFFLSFSLDAINGCLAVPMPKKRLNPNIDSTIQGIVPSKNTGFILKAKRDPSTDEVSFVPNSVHAFYPSIWLSGLWRLKLEAISPNTTKKCVFTTALLEKLYSLVSIKIQPDLLKGFSSFKYSLNTSSVLTEEQQELVFIGALSVAHPEIKFVTIPQVQSIRDKKKIPLDLKLYDTIFDGLFTTVKDSKETYYSMLGALKYPEKKEDVSPLGEDFNVIERKIVNDAKLRLAMLAAAGLAQGSTLKIDVKKNLGFCLGLTGTEAADLRADDVRCNYLNETFSTTFNNIQTFDDNETSPFFSYTKHWCGTIGRNELYTDGKGFAKPATSSVMGEVYNLERMSSPYGEGFSLTGAATYAMRRATATQKLGAKLFSTQVAWYRTFLKYNPSTLVSRIGCLSHLFEYEQNALTLKEVLDFRTALGQVSTCEYYTEAYKEELQGYIGIILKSLLMISLVDGFLKSTSYPLHDTDNSNIQYVGEFYVALADFMMFAISSNYPLLSLILTCSNSLSLEDVDSFDWDSVKNQSNWYTQIDHTYSDPTVRRQTAFVNCSALKAKTMFEDFYNIQMQRTSESILTWKNGGGDVDFSQTRANMKQSLNVLRRLPFWHLA